MMMVSQKLSMDVRTPSWIVLFTLLGITLSSTDPWKCEVCQTGLKLSADGFFCSPYECPNNQFWNTAEVPPICDYCGVAFCFRCSSDIDVCDPGMCQPGYLPKIDIPTGNIIDCKAITFDPTEGLNYRTGKIEPCAAGADCKTISIFFISNSTQV